MVLSDLLLESIAQLQLAVGGELAVTFSLITLHLSVCVPMQPSVAVGDNFDVYLMQPLQCCHFLEQNLKDGRIARS